MMIFFKPGNSAKLQPVVIVDYTRSDEQYTDSEIEKYIGEFNKEKLPTEKKVVYSLDYTATFTHVGISYGDSLKQKFFATIMNAPLDLVTLLNIQQYSSNQNIGALRKAINNVIDPHVRFPFGGIVFSGIDGKKVTRQFIIYSSPYNFDSRRLNSNVRLYGASYDSMVMRLKFDFLIEKTKPLIEQISAKLTGTNLKVDSKSLLNKQLPVIDKHYDPEPLDAILQKICQDNNIAFDNINGVLSFHSLSPDKPPSSTAQNKFSFNNSIPGSMISTFSPQNYVSGEFESELYDPQLYTSVLICDDTETNLFANLSKHPEKFGKYSSYRFYVMEYTITDSREKTSVTTKGTNNWLVNNMKLDYLLENKIYTGQL